MYSKLFVTMFMLAASVSYAQEGYEDDEVEMVERNVSRENAEGTVQEDYAKSTNDAYDTKNSPQINIYNANSNANKQNQRARQEAEALADAASESQAKNDSKVESNNDFGAEYISRANDIRRNRKDMEVGTEQKMIEKIEWSRIEDEKERANRLFGNRLDKDYGHNDYRQPEKPQVIVVEKQPEYVKPVEKPVYEKAVVAEESTSWFGQETYLAPMIGTLNYGAPNVTSDTAMGVAIGSRMDTNVSFEGSFLYSQAEMQNYTILDPAYDDNGLAIPGLMDVTAYTFALGVKYNFVGIGRVSPFVGALGAYTLRNYQETRYGDGTGDSNAFDAGLNVGLDVKIAKNFSIGAEYRWMKNLTYDRTEADLQGQSPQDIYEQISNEDLEALEEGGYSAFLVNGKFTF